jgi:flagellar FliL protein
MLIIIVAAVLLMGAGGGFYYIKFVRATPARESAEKSKKERTRKSLAAEDENAEEMAKDEEAPAKKGKEESKSIEMALPDDTAVKKVIELQPFIVNLADKDEPRYLRLTVSIGIAEGGEEKTDPIFTTRVRNAILAVLTTKTSEEILTLEGKTALRKQILKAAQAASEEPHVEAIYITDFIVQL